MNLTNKDTLLWEWRKSIEWDSTLQKWRADVPTSGGFSHTRLFDTMLALNRAFQDATEPEPTATARPLPLRWVECCNKWEAKIEVNGIPLSIGHFRTEPAAQAALDRYFTPTMEKP